MEILSPSEFSSSLLTLLSEEYVENHSFETITTSFNHYFQKQDFFKVGSMLVLLLQQCDLLPLQSQRLTALFLLYEMYKNENLATNPFSPVFYHILCSDESLDQNKKKEVNGFLPKLSSSEHNFLFILLSGNLKDLYKKTPKQIFSQFSANVNLNKHMIINQLKESQSSHPLTAKSGISCVINDPDFRSNVYVDPTICRSTTEKLLTENLNVVEATIVPEFLRLLPPLPFSSGNELIWLNPISDQELFKIEWDESMCTEECLNVNFESLFTESINQSLLPKDQQKLLSELEKNPSLAQKANFSPNKLHSLVENNPLIAIEVLTNMKNSNQSSEYYSALVNMTMSLHSIEVVNRLITAVELPKDFISLYITNCISACENIKDNKYTQNRLVRLLCVFLQSLIRNKVINLQDLYIEIQAFCIEFSSIKEAAGLFKLIKNFDNENKSENNSSFESNNV